MRHVMFRLSWTPPTNQRDNMTPKYTSPSQRNASNHNTVRVSNLRHQKGSFLCINGGNKSDDHVDDMYRGGVDVLVGAGEPLM